MTVVNIHEAKSQLSKLIQLMLEGEEVIIAKNNKPVAELKPYTGKKTKKRVFGKLKGKIWVSEDCWDHDQELEDSFYESKIFPDENTD